MVSTRIYALALGALTLASCASSSAEEALPPTSAVTTSITVPASSPPPTAAKIPPQTTPSSTAEASRPGDAFATEVTYEIGLLNQEFISSFDACVAAPGNCTVSTLPVLPGSPFADGVAKLVQTFRDNEWYAIPGGAASYAVIGWDAETLSAIDEQTTDLMAGVCAVDAGVTMDSMGTPDPADDQVVSDQVLSTSSSRTFTKFEGRWLLSSVTNDVTVEGDTCSD